MWRAVSLYMIAVVVLPSETEKGTFTTTVSQKESGKWIEKFGRQGYFEMAKYFGGKVREVLDGQQFSNEGRTFLAKHKLMITSILSSLAFKICLLAFLLAAIFVFALKSLIIAKIAFTLASIMAMKKHHPKLTKGDSGSSAIVDDYSSSSVSFGTWVSDFFSPFYTTDTSDRFSKLTQGFASYSPPGEYYKYMPVYSLDGEAAQQLAYNAQTI